MNAFAEALGSLHEACNVVAAPSIKLNGHDVTGIVTPIETLQPFSVGGRSQLPKSEISISRIDWNAYRVPDPDATNARNRFTVSGEELRVHGVTDDPSCPWIRFQCGEV